MKAGEEWERDRLGDGERWSAKEQAGDGKLAGRGGLGTGESWDRCTCTEEAGLLS